MVTKAEIQNAMIAVALSQVGVREHGFNKGKEVEEYQKVVDGKAKQEAWCMAFVQWVTKRVCNQYGIESVLFKSENCQQVYIHTPAKYQSSAPVIGGCFIQQSRTESHKGHTGIIRTGSVAGVFRSIEGNTNSAGSSEGDGVYTKYRYSAGNPSRRMRGHIDIVAMIFDALQNHQA